MSQAQYLRTLAFVVLTFAVAFCLAQPYVRADSALVIDANSGKILWSKNPDKLRYPASTTKILTALVFLENVKLSDTITAPADVESITGSSLHLKPYEKISAEDLAYAMLLRSANDGCYTAAVHVAGSVEKFSRMMNERAKEIGCTGSNFTNPHGLHSEDHFTTANDLALIAKEAMKNPTFVKIVGTMERDIVRSKNNKDVLIKTHNSFLMNNEFATGIKTGWTDPAGRCFVGSAELGDLSIITVVLKSTRWLRDSERLAEWTFDKWSYAELIEKDEIVTSVDIEGANLNAVRLAASNDVTTMVRTDITTPYEVVSQDIDLSLPIIAGRHLGTITIKEQDGTEHTVQVYSADEVLIESKFGLTEVLSPAFLLILLVLVGGSWLVRRRVRVRF